MADRVAAQKKAADAGAASGLVVEVGGPVVLGEKAVVTFGTAARRQHRFGHGHRRRRRSDRAPSSRSLATRPSSSTPRASTRARSLRPKAPRARSSSTATTTRSSSTAPTSPGAPTSFSTTLIRALSKASSIWVPATLPPPTPGRIRLATTSPSKRTTTANGSSSRAARPLKARASMSAPRISSRSSSRATARRAPTFSSSTRSSRRVLRSTRSAA